MGGKARTEALIGVSPVEPIAGRGASTVAQRQAAQGVSTSELLAALNGKSRTGDSPAQPAQPDNTLPASVPAALAVVRLGNTRKEHKAEEPEHEEGDHPTVTPGVFSLEGATLTPGGALAEPAGSTDLPVAPVHPRSPNHAGGLTQGLAIVSAAAKIAKAENDARLDAIMQAEREESARRAKEIVDAARESVAETQAFLVSHVFGDSTQERELRQHLADKHSRILARNQQPLPLANLPTLLGRYPTSFDAEGNLTAEAFKRDGIIGKDAIPAPESFDIAQQVLALLTPEQLTLAPETGEQTLEQRYATRVDHVLTLMTQAAGANWKPTDLRTPGEEVKLSDSVDKALAALAQQLGITPLAVFDHAFDDLDINHATLNALITAAQKTREVKSAAQTVDQAAASPVATVAEAHVDTATGPAATDVLPATAPTAAEPAPTATATPAATSGRPAGALKHNGLFDRPMYQPQPARPTHVPHKVDVGLVRTGTVLGFLPLHGIMQKLHLTRQRSVTELPDHQKAVVEQSQHDAEAKAQRLLPGSHVVTVETELMRELPRGLRWLPTGLAHEAHTKVEVRDTDGSRHTIAADGVARAELPKRHGRR